MMSGKVCTVQLSDSENLGNLKLFQELLEPGLITIWCVIYRVYELLYAHPEKSRSFVPSTNSFP